MPRRSRLEVYFEILQSVSKEKLTITHILYKSGASYGQVRKALDLLIEHDLVGKIEEATTTRYGVTDKGKQFIENFRAIQKLLSD